MRLCVDPGLRHCGVAIGVGQNMAHAALVLNPCTVGHGPSIWAAMAKTVWTYALGVTAVRELYIEVPRIYPRSDQRKGDLNDLIELAGVVGAVSMFFKPIDVHHYYPADWKGQVPKKIMTERIRKKLSPAELDNMISVGAKDHNTLDAIGIFLHSVGRL